MKLRLILGDQLNVQHSWFARTDHQILYTMMEVRQETDYVTHHIQKVIGFFAAMRRFARLLQEQGHQVLYFRIDDSANQHNLTENLKKIIRDYAITRLEYLEPDEYRLDQLFHKMDEALGIPVQCSSPEHFLTDRNDLADFFRHQKQFLMERFYRHLRQKHGILMQPSGQPVTGRWNYDQENRKKLPRKKEIPGPLIFEHDMRDLHKSVKARGVQTIGNLQTERFIWPIDRQESLKLLNHFTNHYLPQFGTYQDAMTPDHWALFHSRLSFSLNTKMLHPREVIDAAVDCYASGKNDIDIAQVEGFVRQILGWREFMRGIYWQQMPGYESVNYFEHDQPLPRFYWDGRTHMNCMRHTINQSLEYAYAHHIQRLMVTGNFALLAGVHPDDVDRWYLGIYIDAVQWVEITNTRGMSQFADGGLLATKPYVSSANYMHRMSHYCTDCHYNYKAKTGDQACPFNSLYWHFYDRNRHRLKNNPRVGMMYRVWDKMGQEQQQAILKQARGYLDHINEL
ncbi:MAG: cryptochrome/photolyase family protein [Caldithrix sp.]|nr:cryptochrome/photolyase family protein [Caldithrix sp.]